MSETTQPVPLREDCVFCRIVRGVVDADIIAEDEASIAFLDHRPLFLGHTLLVPKGHYETLPDLPLDLLQPLFASAQFLVRAVEQGTGADGTFMAVNNRVSQSVPHVHIHIVPRRFHDGLKGFFWPRQRSPDEHATKETVRAIREALSRLRSQSSGQ
jgi:histidine triad (HIT) family protein